MGISTPIWDPIGCLTLRLVMNATIVEDLAPSNPSELAAFERFFEEAMVEARQVAAASRFGTIGLEGYLAAIGANPEQLRVAPF